MKGHEFLASILAGLDMANARLRASKQNEAWKLIAISKVQANVLHMESGKKFNITITEL